ncbi:NADP-dependent alcohol dehydrogenase [Mollisia scopiformis]|uniref:NADP-dependent alcohol dehydrogenase n=1 Tax=Mollisia scopiformis TaxID=149040 RepID=A0A194XMA0_MOLSC|nr:NADP-dependent alcohol dehydrogenase [Mollisia scopiformis]KUJ20897.1 NADP-dependent alcohol dehydrogenase [Mollisia scopiformis]
MAFQSLTYLAGDSDGRIHVKHSKRAIGGLEVLVRVSHSGVCGTDVHDRTSGCGLGHEGVGIVEKIGDCVTAVNVGTRVGWGWQFASCGHCRECVSGYRQYCPKSCGQKYGELEQGAFGDYVIKHQDFVYPIPEKIQSKYAGPLQCAGITVYEALDVAGAKPSDRIGIVGLGGLGHLAVQYARAWGCDPVVFSMNSAKKEDAYKLGAKEFHIMPSSIEGTLNVSEGVNVLLLCGGALPDLRLIMPTLARRATIVPLIIQGQPLVIPYMPFMLPGHRIIASTEASRSNHIAALTFAARHGIRPWIEEFPMSAAGLTKALDALKGGKIRYRAVLSIDTCSDLP